MRGSLNEKVDEKSLNSTGTVIVKMRVSGNDKRFLTYINGISYQSEVDSGVRQDVLDSYR